jgi:hypothetical protein
LASLGLQHRPLCAPFAPRAALVCDARRPFRLGQIFEAPFCDLTNQLAQSLPVLCQTVANPPAIRRLILPGHVPDLLKELEPGCQDVRSNSLLRRQELVEASLAEDQVAHDKKRPPVSDQIQGACDRAIRSPWPHGRSRFWTFIVHNTPKFNCNVQLNTFLWGRVSSDNCGLSFYELLTRPAADRAPHRKDAPLISVKSWLRTTHGRSILVGESLSGLENRAFGFALTAAPQRSRRAGAVRYRRSSSPEGSALRPECC